MDTLCGKIPTAITMTGLEEEEAFLPQRTSQSFQSRRYKLNRCIRSPQRSFRFCHLSLLEGRAELLLRSRRSAAEGKTPSGALAYERLWSGLHLLFLGHFLKKARVEVAQSMALGTPSAESFQMAWMAPLISTHSLHLPSYLPILPGIYLPLWRW